MSLVGVSQTGDRLAALEVLRDRLAQEIDDCSDHRNLAALSLRYTDVLAQIDSMPKSQQVSRADEIAERRSSRRRGGAKGAPRAAGA